MKNILVVFAHPAIRKSQTNRAMIDALRDMPGVVVDDLYESYPDFFIDAGHEQSLLRAADVVILQHPLYWYSVPALLKEWMDLVLEFGFAYGPNGTALMDKWLLTATSTGGSADAYANHADGRFTLPQLLGPLQQTARLCGMRYLPPFVVHGAHDAPTTAELQRTARDYRSIVEALRDEKLTEAHWAKVGYLNDCLSSI